MMHSFLRSRLANVISWIVPVSLVILTIGPSAPANPVRAQGAASVDPAAAIWALIPADATVAITINSDPESAQWPVAADLLETAGLEDLIYGALNEILTSGNLSTSNIDPGQSKVLGGSMAFATWGTPSDPTDSAAFYVAADDPEAAFQTLTSQLLVEDGAEIVSLDIPGGRITVDDAGTSAMMLLNDVVVFTESDDAEHIASLVTGAAPTLDAFDPFVEVMEALPEEQIARAWFNGPAAGQESAETLSDFGLSATNLAFVLAVAGPIGSTFTGLGLHAGADGFHWRTAQLPAPIIGPDPPGRGASVDLAESISNEADIYLDGTDLGATPLVQQIIAAIALNAGMRSGEIWGETGQRPNDFALERFRELTGIDLQAELIDQLTGDYQVAIAPNNDVSLVDVLARSELGDPDVVRDLIEKLVVLFNVATIENPELGELTSLEIGQDTLYTISFTDGSDSVDVSFGVIGDQLQVSLSGGAERFPSPSAGSDLGTDQQYLAAFAALPEDEGSRIYIDLADLLPAFGVTDLNPPDDWAIPNRTNATIAGIKALAGIRYAEGDLAITDYVLLIQADERAVPDAPPAAPDATPVAATSLAIGDVSTIDLGEGVLSLSPDGSRAVVGGEGRSFCIVSLSEPTASACTDAVSGADVEHLAWSPDGSLIAVTENSARYFFDSDIWIIDTATGDSTNLTDDGYEGPIPFAASGPGVPPELPLDGTPIFSADGKSLYFSRSVWTGNASSTDIYRINLDGREPERITRIGRQPFLTWGGMHWIDKGTLIVSHGSTDDHPDNGLWTVDVESGRAEQVWRGSGMQYLATPLGLTTEGNVLAQFPLVLAQFPEPVQVCGYGMIDLETGIVTDLKAKDDFCAWSVGLSPDGSRAIISSPAEPALTVVDLATLELTPFAKSGVSAAATDAGIMRPVLTGAGRGPIIWTEDDRLVLLADATTVMTIQLEGSP